MQILAAILIVPLLTDSGWQVLSYRRIPRHAVSFSKQGLEVRVRRSAGPIVYALPSPALVHGLHARGQLAGRLNVARDRQGARGSDDYALRVGLVEAGERRPSLRERVLAPLWLRTLFRLAPPGRGVSSVVFFNLGTDPSQIGPRRRHPQSGLILEQVVAAPRPDGRFDLSVSLDHPIETLAIWIAVDGDDTASTYDLRLEALELRLTAASSPND